MSKHTPGPWTYHMGVDYTQFYDANDEAIFLVDWVLPESLAALIAAAPDMLKALEGAKAFIRTLEEEYTPEVLEGNSNDADGKMDWDIRFHLDDAIAKAKGEA